MDNKISENALGFEPLLVSKRQAAAMLSLCVRSVENLIRARELPSRKIGGRILIPLAGLKKFAERDHPVPGSLEPR